MMATATTADETKANEPCGYARAAADPEFKHSGLRWAEEMKVCCRLIRTALADKNGICPYANDVATAFAFLYEQLSGDDYKTVLEWLNTHCYTEASKQVLAAAMAQLSLREQRRRERYAQVAKKRARAAAEAGVCSDGGNDSDDEPDRKRHKY